MHPMVDTDKTMCQLNIVLQFRFLLCSSRSPSSHFTIKVGAEDCVLWIQRSHPHTPGQSACQGLRSTFQFAELVLTRQLWDCLLTDSGALPQADRHVERPLQPQHTRLLLLFVAPGLQYTAGETEVEVVRVKWFERNIELYR